MDITRNGEELGRMEMELFANHVPRTAENFRSICCRDNKKFYHYKDTKFHRIISDFMAQGGDFSHHNGQGGKSIYGKNFSPGRFNDENFDCLHYKRGLLSMANHGKNTNGS